MTDTKTSGLTRATAMCGLFAFLLVSGCAGPHPVDVDRSLQRGPSRVCGIPLTKPDGVRLVAGGPVPRLRVERMPATFWLDNRGGSDWNSCRFELEAKRLTPDMVHFMRGPFDRCRSELRAAGTGRVAVTLPIEAGSIGIVCIEPRVQAPADFHHWRRDGLVGDVEQGAYLGRRGQEYVIRALGPAAWVQIENPFERRKSVRLRIENVSARLAQPLVEGSGTEGTVIEADGPLALQVRSTLEKGQAVTVRLVPKRLAAPTTVLFGGDVKKRMDVFRRLVDEVERRAAPAYMVAVGDYSEMGLAAGYRDFVEASASLGFPVYHVKGNHEVHCQGDVHFARTFGPAHYHFVAGDLLWVILDSNRWHSDGFRLGHEQLAWLERVLRDNASVPWKMVVLHAPPHPLHGPSGLPDYPANLHPEDAARLKEIATSHGVAYVLSGHAHLYARKQEEGVVYLTSGGGGAELGDYNRLPGFHIDERKHLVLLHAGPAGIEEEIVTADGP